MSHTQPHHRPVATMMRTTRFVWSQIMVLFLVFGCGGTTSGPYSETQWIADRSDIIFNKCLENTNAAEPKFKQVALRKNEELNESDAHTYTSEIHTDAMRGVRDKVYIVDRNDLSYQLDEFKHINLRGSSTSLKKTSSMVVLNGILDFYPYFERSSEKIDEEGSEIHSGRRLETLKNCQAKGNIFPMRIGNIMSISYAIADAGSNNIKYVHKIDRSLKVVGVVPGDSISMGLPGKVFAIQLNGSDNLTLFSDYLNWVVGYVRPDGQPTFVLTGFSTSRETIGQVGANSISELQRDSERSQAGFQARGMQTLLNGFQRK